MGQTRVWSRHALRFVPDALDGVGSTQTHPHGHDCPRATTEALAGSASRRVDRPASCHLHANPELSFEEHETMAFVSAQLTAWGVGHETHVTDTGIVATVRGQNPEARLVALRADMDALPIQEANDVPYASTKPGVMHASRPRRAHHVAVGGRPVAATPPANIGKAPFGAFFNRAKSALLAGPKAWWPPGCWPIPLLRTSWANTCTPNCLRGMSGCAEGTTWLRRTKFTRPFMGAVGTPPSPTCATTPCWPRRPSLWRRNKPLSRGCPPGTPSVLSFGRVEALGATNVLLQRGFHPRHLPFDERRAWRKKAHVTMMEDIIHSYSERPTDVARNWKSVCGYPHVHNEVALTSAFKRVGDRLPRCRPGARFGHPHDRRRLQSLRQRNPWLLLPPGNSFAR